MSTGQGFARSRSFARLTPQVLTLLWGPKHAGAQDDKEARGEWSVGSED
jgi:hypothetical protein